MNLDSKNNLIYLGTIDNFNSNLNFIRLRDIAVGYDLKNTCTEIYYGYSRTFLENLKIKKFECLENQIFLYLDEHKITDSKNLINKAVFIEKKFLIDKKPDFYLIEDLLGCDVINIDNGNLIGKISDVSILPSNDVWFIQTEKGELPIPVIKDVVKKVDISKKCIYIKLLDGLFDLTNSKTDEEA
ncbi:MAG: PRC-barrel domain-containing protein [Candidatus Kapabacteria bacterium]|nr:PRC-barrel domain-containing protein [Candidatus Kapabacteria bacterium]